MRPTFITLLTILLLAASARSDEVRNKGEAAIRAWEGGNAEEAIELFHDAIGLIQSRTEAGLSKALPDRAGDFVGDEIQSSSGNWGSGKESVQWISATRRYSIAGTSERVTVTLSTSPQMVQGQQAMLATFQDPQTLAMMNTVPGKRVHLVEESGFQGWMVVEEGKTAQMTAVGERLMLNIDVHHGSTAALAVFREAIPLGGLVRLDGR
jgi:hypothetical protein